LSQPWHPGAVPGVVFEAPANRLGLGTAAIGRPAYINLGHRSDLGGRPPAPAALEAHAHAVLDAAHEAGVRYVDAARSYGRAEAFVASWLALRGEAAADVVVGSKWGYTYVADWDPDAAVHEIKDHSLAAYRRQRAETDAVLGRRLSLYQIHSATRDTGVLADEVVLDALADLRDAGIAVGVTTSGPAQADTIDDALGVQRGGDRLFSVVQSTWNLLEPSAGPALATAHDAGLTVIVKEAVANGRLAGREPAVADRLGAHGDGASPDAVALACVLAQPWAGIVLSGASTPQQVHSNVAALEVTVDADALADLADLAEPPADYWSRRAGLPWQ
jgi:aryl-alcohol dehydrogenase-like predicted oxidoreductase